MKNLGKLPAVIPISGRQAPSVPDCVISVWASFRCFLQQSDELQYTEKGQESDEKDRAYAFKIVSQPWKLISLTSNRQGLGCCTVVPRKPVAMTHHLPVMAQSPMLA